VVTILDTSPGYWYHANIWDKVISRTKNLVTKEFELFESTAKKTKVSFHSKIIESHSITKQWCLIPNQRKLI